MFHKKVSLVVISLFIGIEIHLNQELAIAQNIKLQTPTQTSEQKSICPAQLQFSIDKIINRPIFKRMRWGILIKPLSADETLYSRDAEKYFIPASNTKLFTTAAVLNKLGANFRIRTSVYQDAEGVLRIVGRGDPSFKNQQLTILAKQLYQKGIREIDKLIADDSYFQGEVIHPSWEWEDVQFYYAAPVNSLIVNENAAVLFFLPQAVGKPLKIEWANPIESYGWKIENSSLTTQANKPSSVEIYRDLKGQILRIQGNLSVNSKPKITAIAVFNPVKNFLQHFRLSLAKQGIKVKRTLQINGGKNQLEIAGIDSPPLSELLKETNVNSNNLFAEALLKTLGSQKPLAVNQTSLEAGLEVLKTNLTELGIPANSYMIVDGSGLSRKNLITPEATIQLLQVMAKSNNAKIFTATLPIAGVSGSLKNRFLKTSAENNVQAKTGTMSGVVSLSGYVNVPNYQPIVFSIMVNQSQQPASVIRNAIDEIVVLLTQLKSC